MRAWRHKGFLYLADAPGDDDSDFAKRVWRKVSSAANYHGRHKRWRIPLSNDAVLGLEAMGAALAPEVEDWKVEQGRLEKARERANELIRQSPDFIRGKLDGWGVRWREQPYAHQVISIAYALMLRACGLYLDTGTGKTFVAGVYMQALVDLKGHKKFLVMAPKSILNTGWGEDLGRFTWLKWVNISDPPAREPVLDCPLCQKAFKKHVSWQHLSTHLREQIKELGVDAVRAELYDRHPELVPPGREDKRSRLLRALESDAQVFLINPEGFKLVVDELTEQDWDGFIIDEASVLKSHDSQITHKTIAFGASVKRRVIMTATPRPNSSRDFWGQMAFLDMCLGGSFTAFRNKYYYSDYNKYNWYPKSDDVDDRIRDIVFKRCIRFRLDDCVDLPGESYEIMSVDLDGQLREHYEDMKRKMMIVLNSGETVETSWLIVQMNKLAQINSGFIFDDYGGARFLGDSPKIQATIEMSKRLIESEDRSVLIWVRFPDTEGRMIQEALSEYGVSTMHGGTRDPDKNSDDFKHGRTKVMIAHPQSAKFGHTWVTHCNVDIWHSYGYSFEDFHQGKRRIYRIGQKRPVTHIVNIANKTVDEVIWERVMLKQDASETVVDENVIDRLRKDVARRGRR